VKVDEDEDENKQEKQQATFAKKNATKSRRQVKFMDIKSLSNQITPCPENI
jgi:hypothetical protein